MNSSTPKLGKRLGRIADTPDQRDFFVEASPLRGRIPGAGYWTAAIAPLPPIVDVFHGLSLPVYDQGELGSCTANAGVLYRRFLAQKFSKYSAPDMDLSRLFLYYQERKLPWNHSVAEDSGAQVRDTFKALAQVGVCTEQYDPYDPVAFASQAANESQADYETAALYKIGAYHRIPDVNTARSVLASGYAIELGFAVYESFESIGADGVMPMPKVPGEQGLGGHAVVIHGYDDQNSEFIIQNSWGPLWGNHGHFRMPYAFLEDTKLSKPDMWMGHLGRPWRSK